MVKVPADCWDRISHDWTAMIKVLADGWDKPTKVCIVPADICGKLLSV